MSMARASKVPVEPVLVDVPARAHAPEKDSGSWGLSAGIALAAHAAAIVALTAAVVPTEPTEPEPVVLVELPPLAGADEPSVAEAKPEEPQPQLETPQPLTPILPVELPPTRVPVRDAVTLPPPPPEPVRTVQAPVVTPVAPVINAPAPVRSGSANASSDLPGDDPKSRKLEADYKSLVGSYIRRNRFSPPQSRKAGISGAVKVRFVVHRNGAISDVSVARSSGERLLDSEATEFIRDLSPVPSFPRDLRRSEIPLAITLKFKVESK